MEALRRLAPLPHNPKSSSDHPAKRPPCYLQVCGGLLLDTALVPRIGPRPHHQLLPHQRAATTPAAPASTPAIPPTTWPPTATHAKLWCRQHVRLHGAIAACCCCCWVATADACLAIACHQEAAPVHELLALDEQHTPADGVYGACAISRRGNTLYPESRHSDVWLH